MELIGKRQALKASSEIIFSENNWIRRNIENLLAERAIILPLFHEQGYRFARKEVEAFDIKFCRRSINSRSHSQSPTSVFYY
jgi:hypothetical protein